jgi:alkylation response protein AidB-like acyl-CoA dehydrogenase
VILPAHHLIGEPGGATVCMMRNLEIERVVLAAMGVRPAGPAGLICSLASI